MASLKTRYLDWLLMHVTKFSGENDIGWLKSFLHNNNISLILLYLQAFTVVMIIINDKGKGNAP